MRVALQTACSSRSPCRPCGKVDWRVEIASSFSSFPYANAISFMLNPLLLAGDGWGVPGEGDRPFLGLGENRAVPLIKDMAKNTKNRKFCKEGIRTGSKTFKNEISTLKIVCGGPQTPAKTPRYNAERWALQQQARIVRQRRKQQKGQSKPTGRARSVAGHRERCPGRRGAKRSVGAYTVDFYAGPVMSQGTRRGPQWRSRGTTTKQRSPGRGGRFSPRRASVPRPDAQRFGRGCHDRGCAPHANTDNVPHALQWAGG